jgi:hypothetical protein
MIIPAERPFDSGPSHGAASSTFLAFYLFILLVLNAKFLPISIHPQGPIHL